MKKKFIEARTKIEICIICKNLGIPKNKWNKKPWSVLIPLMESYSYFKLVNALRMGGGK